jgi:hypothetical protein
VDAVGRVDAKVLVGGCRWTFTIFKGDVRASNSSSPGARLSVIDHRGVRCSKDGGYLIALNEISFWS